MDTEKPTLYYFSMAETSVFYDKRFKSFPLKSRFWIQTNSNHLTKLKMFLDSFWANFCYQFFQTFVNNHFVKKDKNFSDLDTLYIWGIYFKLSKYI